MTDLGGAVTWILIVVAWVSSIWWGRQYRAAKEGEISSLRTQIELLHQRNPEALRERVVATRQLWEQMRALLTEDVGGPGEGRDEEPDQHEAPSGPRKQDSIGHAFINPVGPALRKRPEHGIHPAPMETEHLPSPLHFFW